MTDFRAARVLDVELGKPIPDIPAEDPASGETLSRALALVRLHTQPVGTVDLALGASGIGSRECAQQIWGALAKEIRSHLRADGLPEVTGLDEQGLPDPNPAPCLSARYQLLGDAPLVSVIVPTRDRADVLARCLRSLLNLEYPHYELLVVDNAPSDDETERLIADHYGHFQHVRYLREDRPGVSAARNRGIAEARGRIIAFTDDDVVVDRFWLLELAKAFRLSHNVGCVTGLVLPMELATQSQQWFEEFGGFGKDFQRRIYDVRENRPEDRLFPYAAGRFGSGNNMALRADVVRSIGGFDTRLGGGTPARGGEDLAAFVDVLRKGYALAYEPAAIAYHQHRRTYAGLRDHIYGYGIGLTAFLTRCVAEKPSSLFEFAAKVPFGLVYAISSNSAKNRKKRLDYPRELTDLERRGMLWGPIAYLRSRWSDERESPRTIAARAPKDRARTLRDRVEVK